MTDKLESLVITFTGNRNIRATDVRAALQAVHMKYPNSIWRTGMAYGLDMAVAEFAASHDIPYEAHLPFEPHIQVSRWIQSSRDRYFKLLDRAVRVFTHSSGFSMAAYQSRNVKMADGATAVVAFNRHSHGGTVNMINHCKNTGIPVIDGFSLS